MPADTKIQTQSEVEEKMVDLPSEGESVDVKFDTEKIVNSEEPDEVKVEEGASQEEVDDYGHKVQSRIDKLTKRLRESERREAAAVQYAQGVQSESAQIRQRANAIDAGYTAEFGDRVVSQISEAKKELKEAMDLGDVDKQVEVQTKLGRLAIEEERANTHKAQRERLAWEMQQRGIDPNRPQMPQYQPPRPQAPPPPDPKAEDWAEKNKWFGEDEPMTLTSFSIHRKLVEEGFDTTSDSYYNEVDKRMKDTFPHRFDKSSTPTQAVASANRGGPIRRKGTVRLTPSQVAISKKLGVPLSEYAKYVKE
jgi:hypothetical protein